MNFGDWNSVGRKEYELSLKSKIYNHTKKNYCEQNNGESVNKKSSNKGSENSFDSQNFNLNVTNSLLTDDSAEINVIVNYNEPSNQENQDVIVISDSSDEGSCPLVTTKRFQENQIQFLTTNTSHEGVTETQSKNYEDSDNLFLTNEDENIFTGSIKNYKPENFNEGSENRSIIKYVSDESYEQKMTDMKYCLPVNRLNSSITLTPGLMETNHIFHENTDYTKKVKNKQFESPISSKLSECTTPLARKVVANIKKTIDSRRVILFDSPPHWNKKTIIDETESDSDEDDNLNKRKKINYSVLGKKTISDQELIDYRHTVLPKPQQLSHIIPTLESSITRGPFINLSESKKYQISNWLMNNPDESKSDDSLSQVPPSINTPPGSGNSSLERLEVNYETPNNRNKFHWHLNCDNKNSSRTLTTIKPVLKNLISDSYFKKKKKILVSKKNYTPIPISIPKSVLTKSSSKNKSKTDIHNYNDILEKLYGRSWKDKILENSTSGHNQEANITVRNSAVQTKSKKKIVQRANKNSTSTSSSSDENCHNPSNRRRFFDIHKKTKTIIKKPSKDNFIDDSYGDTGDTTYLTALTTPRFSLEKKKKNTPISVTTRPAIEICDSSTENKGNPIKIKDSVRVVDNKKQSTFSDDDRTSTGTSEYDPYDIILPKSCNKSIPELPCREIVSKLPVVNLSHGLRNTESFLKSLSASVLIENTHPDAKKYKINFKNTKEDLCKVLYTLYNKNIFDNQLPPDMPIEWNVRMRGTAGFCYNKKSTKTIGGITRSSRIVLASKILDSADRLRDTLVHEMCHAAAWILNEVCDGHGPFWKAWAAKAMKTFPDLPPIRRCHDYKISTKFTYRCTLCGYSIGRHSKSLDVNKKRCGHCFGKFELLINRLTTSTKLQTSKQKEPMEFALYIKENYGSVKEGRQGVAHKELMQILGQQFSAIKIGKKK